MEKGKINHGSWLETLSVSSYSVFLALAMFFSWIMLVNVLRMPFYLYYQRTVYLIYVSRFLDPIIWLAFSTLTVIMVASRTRGRPVWYCISILLWSGIALGTLTLAGLLAPQLVIVGPLATLAGCVFTGLATIRDAAPRSRLSFAAVFLLVLALLVLPVELGTFLYYAMSGFRPGIEVGKSWEPLELQLWYVASQSIPFLYVLLVFSWIWIPLVARIMSKLTRRSRKKEIAVNSVMNDNSAWPVIIGGCILCAVLVGYYPYFHDGDYPLVGTDIYWRYAMPAQRVLSSSSWITASVKERHPLMVLAITTASSLLGMDPASLLRFAYVVLILALSGATFALVFIASKSRLIAAASTMIISLTPAVTAEIYTGTLAEWAALVAWTIVLAFLVVPQRDAYRSRALMIGALSLGSVAVLFLHPWTWVVVILGFVTYCLAAIALRLKDRRYDVGAIASVILLNGVVAALAMIFIPEAQGWRSADALTLVWNSLSGNYVGFGIWDTLVSFSRIWSQFLHPTLLVLSILGAGVILSRRDRFAALMMAWLATASVLSLVSALIVFNPTLATRGELFRAVPLVPFGITASAGLLLLKSTLDDRLARAGHAQAANVVAVLVTAVIFLSILNGALRALFPLLTDPHNYPWPSEP